MKYLTIFTPTYNRAYTLKKCYESLVSQTSQNFIWQIVDDGSTDNTESLVNGFIKEHKIEIEYYKKENGGKVSAINYSLEKTYTEMWLCLDSDDYLFDDAVEVIERNKDRIQDDKICGLFGLRSLQDRTPMQKICLPSNVKNATQTEVRYKYKVPPEYYQVYKSSVIKKYRYPLFDGEKYMPLSYMQDQIDQEYEFALLDDAIMVCYYQEDGITNHQKKLVKNNPRGYKEFKRQQMVFSKDFISRIKACVAYDTGCILSKEYLSIIKSPFPLYTTLLFLGAVIDYFVRYRKLN